MKQIMIFIFFCLTSLVSFSQENTLYWVGGVGNWNDLTHWSTQSGTIGVHNASSVPTADTHVVFDSGSGISGGRIIEVTGAAANAKSLTMTNDLTASNSPIFNGNAITVKGNITTNQFVALNGGIISNPNLGETAILNFNQAHLAGLIKNLAGNTIIQTAYTNAIDLTINLGNVEYLPSTILLNDLIANSGNFKMPNVAIFSLNNVGGWPTDGTLEFKNDVTINVNNWSFLGNVIAPLGVFNVAGNFQNSSDNIRYNKVVLNAENATIVGSVGICHFNELVLNGKKITVSHGKSIDANKIIANTNSILEYITGGTLIVNESFNVNSVECNSFFKLTSANGVVFNNNSNNTLTLDNFIAESVDFTSTNPTIVNGINYESNGNVVFNAPLSNDFYWIGSANDKLWNNPLNWSSTSGGAPGSCTPSPTDNVFFDNASVINGEIIISGKEAFANNVTITATTTFSINGLPINVSGNWSMTENKTINSTVNFKTTSPERLITSNGSSFSNVLFKGTGGWKLADPFKTTQDVILKSGTLNTNDKNVFIGNNFSAGLRVYPSFYRNLILGASEFSVNETFDYLMQDPGNTYGFDAGTSHIILRNGKYIGTVSQVFYNVTVYDPSLDNSGSLFIDNIGSPFFNNLVIFSKSVDFRRGFHQNNVTLFANTIKITPISNAPVVRVFSNLDVNNFEIASTSNLSVLANLNFKVNNSFIANTPDCSGLMQFYVMNGNFFNFTSQNNVLINNAFLTGVKADISTSATYSITGVLGDNTTGFNLLQTTSKNLYWIGSVSSEWNNPLNWTTDSTGQQSINPCVPSPNDNVYFEAFSGNGAGGKTVNISNSVAFFRNFTGNNAPNSMIFQGLTLNGYGDEMKFGNGMQIKSVLNHYGLSSGTQTNFIGSNSGDAIIEYVNFYSKTTNYQWNVNNDLKIKYDVLLNGGTLNFNSPSVTFRDLYMNDGVFNVPNTLEIGILTYIKGNINAAGKTISMGRLTGSSNQYREFDITNAIIHCGANWQLFNWDSAPSKVFGEGSYITFGGSFQVHDGQVYGTIENTSLGSPSLITGDSSYEKIVLNKSTLFGTNITTKVIEIKPRGITLELGQSTNFTVTNDMFINGSPCALNNINGLGTGANITYLNPNNHNSFDFVEISSINALNADLIFGVNSSVVTSNNKVIKLPGAPGVDGLGADRFCQSNYSIIATAFNGSPTSNYYWYKKNSLGEFIQLNVPLNSVSIDTRDFGYDGTYRAKIVYDPEGVVCENIDEIYISFVPIDVEFESAPLGFCIGTTPTLADVRFDAATTQYIQDTGAVLKWYSAATGGSQLPLTTSLSENTTYYASLTNGVSCESVLRKPITITFNAIPVSNAGPDQSGVAGQTFTMQANNPTIGIGKWIVLSGDVTITDIFSYNTTVTLVSGEKAELLWEVNNNGCKATDELLIGKLPFTPMVNPSNRIRVSGN